jgi:hypothetical protein
MADLRPIPGGQELPVNRSEGEGAALEVALGRKDHFPARCMRLSDAVRRGRRSQCGVALGGVSPSP